MAIFSDKCTALIDSSTGRALSGEALEQGRQEKKHPKCGNKVRKAARFCNKCGTPAPGGWWRCSGCRKWIGNDSKFCPHCDTRLYPEDRADMAGGVWSKSGDVFARRFEIGDIKRLLTKDLQVQAGTQALLLDGGKYKGMLDSGTHNPDSLARKLNHFGNPPPRSVVLLDSADVVLPMRVEGLQTADPFPIEFYGEIILRFDGDNKAALAFISNLMKDRRELLFADILERLNPDIRHAVDAMCVKSTVDDLVRDPERRLRLADEIGRYVEGALAAYGMTLVRVSSAEFLGQEYEAHAGQLVELETTRRTLEYDQRMRSLLTQEQMASFKDEQELIDYQATLAHEYGITQARRDREQKDLLDGWRHQDELTELRHKFVVEQEAQGDDIGRKVEWEAYERDRSVKDASAQVQVRQILFDQEKTEKEWETQRERDAVALGMDIRKKKDERKAANRQADVDRRKGLNELELLADIDDPDLRATLMAALKLKAQAGMTPEQLLAMAAESSGQAADALARMKEGNEAHYRELLEEMKGLYGDAADRQDRNLKVTLEPAVEAAKRNDGNQTIVK
ncbi:MAG: hypothetical protein ACI87O_001162 [Planctomycetota bacterium]|jgi:hypothetical protein